VQRFPSSHAVPFGFATGGEHAPVAGLHEPAALQASVPPHTTGLEPLQTPRKHASTCVHALPSLHAVPFGFDVGGEQPPVAGLHVPAS
jgi:hypothetical protein